MISPLPPSLPRSRPPAERYLQEARTLNALHTTLDRVAETLVFPGLAVGSVATPTLGAAGLLAAGGPGAAAGLVAGCALTGASVLSGLLLGNAADYLSGWASDKYCQAEVAAGTVPNLGLPKHTLQSPTGEALKFSVDPEVGSAHFQFPAGDHTVELFSRRSRMRDHHFHLEARDALNERYVLDGKMDSPNREDPYFRGELTVTGPHGFSNVFRSQN